MIGESNFQTKAVANIAAQSTADAGMAHLLYLIEKQLLSKPTLLTSTMTYNPVTGQHEWSTDQLTYLTQSDPTQPNLDTIAQSWASTAPTLEGNIYRIQSIQLTDRNGTPILSATIPFPKVSHACRIVATVQATHSTTGQTTTRTAKLDLTTELQNTASGTWTLKVHRVTIE